MSTPLRVAVVSRHELVRAGLCQLLGTDPGRATVVATQEASTDLPDHDVAIYDLTGSDAQAGGLRLLLESTPMPVVIVTTEADADLAARLLGQGIAGLVTMDVTPDALLTRLERAASGRRASTSELRKRSRQAAHGTAAVSYTHLTLPTILRV